MGSRMRSREQYWVKTVVLEHTSEPSPLQSFGPASSVYLGREPLVSITSLPNFTHTSFCPALNFHVYQ